MAKKNCLVLFWLHISICSCSLSLVSQGGLCFVALKTFQGATAEGQQCLIKSPQFFCIYITKVVSKYNDFGLIPLDFAPSTRKYMPQPPGVEICPFINIISATSDITQPNDHLN